MFFFLFYFKFSTSLSPLNEWSTPRKRYKCAHWATNGRQTRQAHFHSTRTNSTAHMRYVDVVTNWKTIRSSEVSRIYVLCYIQYAACSLCTIRCTVLASSPSTANGGACAHLTTWGSLQLNVHFWCAHHNMTFMTCRRRLSWMVGWLDGWRSPFF